MALPDLLITSLLYLLKLTFDNLSRIVSAMTDSALSDRSRLYSVAELASEFSLTSQGIRFYEESGLIAPARTMPIMAIGNAGMFGSITATRSPFFTPSLPCR